MNIMRTENYIDEGMLLHNTANDGFFLRHAAAYAENKLRLLQLKLLQMTKLAEHLVFRILTHSTGIEQNNIGSLAILRRRIAHLLENPFHHFGIMLVHLAAISRNHILLAFAELLHFRRNRRFIMNLNLFFAPVLPILIIGRGVNRYITAFNPVVVFPSSSFNTLALEKSKYLE